MPNAAHVIAGRCTTVFAGRRERERQDEMHQDANGDDA